MSSVSVRKKSAKAGVRKSATPEERLNEIGIDALCEFIAAGNSLRGFCREFKFVSAVTVAGWINRDPERSVQYARAREIRADALVEEIMSISDNGANDTYVDKKGRVRTNWEVVNRSRLRVDSRKWFASKLAPKIYGERQIIAGDPEAPLAGSLLDEAAVRNLSQSELTTLKSLLAKAKK